ncbi:glycosyltransferase [Selenomonas montiformis]|uniref:glycosyltransferase n=1 Tax=Selenomonas montiformis TaxID=2652285 RepID=UPI0039F47D8D
MKITGCYLVRNEAAQLRRSLQSIQGQVDEILVVDTGSSDDSVKAAEEYHARILRYPWQADFSKARNFALEHLQGDWVVFLDADEYVSPETASHLRGIIEAQPAEVDLLLVRRRDVREDGSEMLSLYVPRIFRIRPELRYEGRIHEELRQNGQTIRGIAAVPQQDLLLIHTGYAGVLGREKAERNLRMLLAEEAQSAHPERLYGYLAEACDGVGDRARAMDYARRDIARGRQQETYASRSYRLLLEKLAERPQDNPERQRMAAQAVQDYPELPEFHAEYAESLAAGLSYSQAAVQMRQALELGAGYGGLEPSLFDEGMAKRCRERLRLFERIVAAAKGLSVTACAIVRNEAENLPDWLNNTRTYARQIVVLDTGSTDATRELAAKEAELHVQAWTGNFAAARNAALSYAAGKWIAFLDADETFDHPERVISLLARTEVLHPEAEAVRLTIRNVDRDDGGREISHFQNVRLFRGDRGLRYEGRVHENLCRADGSAPVVCSESDKIQVIHTGYSSSLVQAKAQRNLALLQEDIREYGEGPQHYRYLADSYLTLGDYERAELYGLRAIDAPLQGVGTQGDMYYLVLQCMEAREEPLEEQLDFARAAMKAFPKAADFPAVAGCRLYDAGRYRQALPFLRLAVELYHADRQRQSSHFADLSALVYAGKSACEEKAGNSAQAEADLQAAMQANPCEDAALTLYCDRLRSAGPGVLRQRLGAYFGDTEQDRRFLTRFFVRHGYFDLADAFGDGPCRKFRDMAMQGRWQQLTGEMQMRLAQDIELALRLLLRLESRTGRTCRQMERQLCRLLPQDILQVWLAYQGKGAVTDWDSYRLVWPYIRRYGGETQILRFAALGRNRPKLTQQLAEELIREEKWQAAFSLLEQVSSEQADGGFWEDTGICLYHLGKRKAAVECFGRARADGRDTDRMKAYEMWMENGDE